MKSYDECLQEVRRAFDGCAGGTKAPFNSTNSLLTAGLVYVADAIKEAAKSSDDLSKAVARDRRHRIHGALGLTMEAGVDEVVGAIERLQGEGE